MPLSRKISSELKQHIAELPDSPGVYLFWGESGQLLYVGKSKTIRTRVRSHFANRDERLLCRQVRSIEPRQTAGELGALLLESQLIKELRPLYNVMSREKRRLIIARGKKTRSGYATVTLEAVDRIDPSSLSPLVAIFRTKTQAREYLDAISKSHRLCPKLLGLESTRRHCFSYHLGQCNGACMNEEDPAVYNKRFELAFSERRIKAWPFEGAVIIEERAENNNEGEVFIVDHWCLLYSFRYSLMKYDLQIRGTYRFDYDSYRILASYIFDDVNRERITTISKQRLRLLLAETSETPFFQ